MPWLAVSRSRLVATLDLAVEQRVTIVVAPPGYGKTVLISQWAASHPRQALRWLTLTAEHNDAGRLARDLCGALVPMAQLGGSGLIARVDSSGRQLGAPFLAALLGTLTGAPPTTLVLDDFHLLTNTALLDDLGTLLEHAPRTLRVIVATRVDPPLRYYGLRLSSPHVELRQEDLAFTQHEAAELIRRMAGRDLSGTQIEALLGRTEGWAAGLHLAALSLREQTDVEQFVETFAGDDRHVADYLTAQVLYRQPESVRRFLLSTSVLDRMTGSLCDTLTGESGGHAMLEELARTSMFVTRLDARRSWFGYHPLFRALLRHHLRDEDASLERKLLRRAAKWHFGQGDLEVGVHYLVQAEAWEDVIDAAFTYGPAMLARGNARSVADWFDPMPRSIRNRRVPVMLLEAAGAVVGGDTPRAAETLDEIANITSASPGERLVADLLQGFAALQQGSSARAVVIGERVLAALEGVDEADLPNVLGFTGSHADIAVGGHFTRGLGLMYEGSFAEARASLHRAMQDGHAMWQAAAIASLALLEAWAGCLSTAEQLGTRAISLVRELGIDQQPVATDAFLALAAVAREHDELDRAAEFLDDAARRAGPGRPRAVAALVAVEEARLALARGEPAAGLAVLSARRPAEPPPLPPAVLAQRRVAEAHLSIVIGDLDAAARSLDVGAVVETSELLAARARLAVERGDMVAARKLIASWPVEPEPRARLERTLWEAILDHLDGNEPVARGGMASVVAEAEVERNFGLFEAAGQYALGPARSLYRTAPTPFLRAVVDRPTARRGSVR